MFWTSLSYSCQDWQSLTNESNGIFKITRLPKTGGNGPLEWLVAAKFRVSRWELKHSLFEELASTGWLSFYYRARVATTEQIQRGLQTSLTQFEKSSQPCFFKSIQPAIFPNLSSCYPSRFVFISFFCQALLSTGSIGWLVLSYFQRVTQSQDWKQQD